MFSGFGGVGKHFLVWISNINFTNKYNELLHSLSFNISWFSGASFLNCDYWRWSALLLSVHWGCIYVTWFDTFLGDLFLLSVRLATAWAKQDNLFFVFFLMFFFAFSLASTFQDNNLAIILKHTFIAEYNYWC